MRVRISRDPDVLTAGSERRAAGVFAALVVVVGGSLKDPESRPGLAGVSLVKFLDPTCDGLI